MRTITGNELRTTTKVNFSDLKSFVRSKYDIYHIITVEGQYHMPPFDDCNMEFMRAVLRGDKKVIALKDL